jgi:RNA polymerase sigma-70 factor, ECF subfamily
MRENGQFQPAPGSDEELVTRIQRGDVDAFEELYRRHGSRIARFIRMVGVPPDDVDDLTAETFCRALSRIDSFEVARKKRYLSYLYSIARNLAADRIRYRPRMLSLEEMEEGWEPSDEWREDRIVEEIYRVEQASLIYRAIDELSPSDREILLLAYDRSLSSREIMEIMEKPSVTAVTSHVYKAMQRLRRLVERLGRETSIPAPER